MDPKTPNCGTAGPPPIAHQESPGPDPLPTRNLFGFPCHRVSQAIVIITVPEPFVRRQIASVVFCPSYVPCVGTEICLQKEFRKPVYFIHRDLKRN